MLVSTARERSRLFGAQRSGLRNQRAGAEQKFAAPRNSTAVIAGIVICVVLTLAIPTSAQPRKIGRVHDVTGMGTVTRQAAGPRALAVTEDVFVGDTITTASQSHVRIGFAPGALAELGEGSVVTIAEEAGRPVLKLDNGGVYYRVSREGDRRDEVRAVLTPNAIGRTTGSVSLKVNRAPDTVLVTRVCVLEGTGSAAALGGAEVKGVLGTIVPLPPSPLLPPIPKPTNQLAAANRCYDSPVI